MLVLFRMIRAIEERLENNVLFPRALQLAAAAG
jgi:hypothetical protein